MAESRRLRTQADEHGNVADDCGHCTLLPSVTGYVRAVQVGCPVHSEHPGARRLRTQAERDADGTTWRAARPRCTCESAMVPGVPCRPWCATEHEHPGPDCPGLCEPEEPARYTRRNP